MLIMLEAIWPSLKTYHNAIPTSAGIASNKMIAYFVFWTREFSRACPQQPTDRRSPISPRHDPPF